jgi:hypothetical protein
MRVFQTSNGMPSDAASAIWINGPMATSMMGMTANARGTKCGESGDGGEASVRIEAFERDECGV